MAIHPATSGLSQRREPVDVAEWTSLAAEELANLAVSAPSEARAVRGTSVRLNIPLDEEHPPARPVRPLTGLAHKQPEGAVQDDDEVKMAYKRREPARRDSLKRREALLKGKEGSRRRQRWENDRLLNNPYAQPPLPSDWEVHPTYPVHVVPYYLAPLWDAGVQARYEERKQQAKARAVKDNLTAQPSAGVPKDLRDKLKRARGAKALLMDLEEEVRRFVENWNDQERKPRADASPDPDSDEDEVVFVGRNGEMIDMPRSPRISFDSIESEKLVFDSLEDDHCASFGRWLVHSIGQYYGLNTWSITVGDPARREAYVGIKENRLKSGRSKPPAALPRPLYGLV